MQQIKRMRKEGNKEYLTSAHAVQMTVPAYIHGTCVNTQVP